MNIQDEARCNELIAEIRQEFAVRVDRGRANRRLVVLERAEQLPETLGREQRGQALDGPQAQLPVPVLGRVDQLLRDLLVRSYRHGTCRRTGCRGRQSPAHGPCGGLRFEGP